MDFEPRNKARECHRYRLQDWYQVDTKITIPNKRIGFAIWVRFSVYWLDICTEPMSNPTNHIKSSTFAPPFYLHCVLLIAATSTPILEIKLEHWKIDGTSANMCEFHPAHVRPWRWLAQIRLDKNGNSRGPDVSCGFHPKPIHCAVWKMVWVQLRSLCFILKDVIAAPLKKITSHHLCNVLQERPKTIKWATVGQEYGTNRGKLFLSDATIHKCSFIRTMFLKTP